MENMLFMFSMLHKCFFSILITTLKITGTEVYDTQMAINTYTLKEGIILARELQKHFLESSH